MLGCLPLLLVSLPAAAVIQLFTLRFANCPLPQLSPLISQAATHLHVQLMVEVLVNLLAVPVLAQQAPQHTQAADPQQLGGQAGLTGTTALTWRGWRGEQEQQGVAQEVSYLAWPT